MNTYQTNLIKQADDTTTAVDDESIIQDGDDNDTTPSPTPPQDAIIQGTVYNDVNKNNVQDVDEETLVLSNVIVNLFTCSNGSRVGITRTNDEGTYTFTIPYTALPPLATGDTVCHYIQFTVPEESSSSSSTGLITLTNAEFSFPLNGETSDIYIGRGQTITNVNAGVYSSTPSPTGQWVTYMPTMEDGTTAMPTESIPVSAPISSAPISIAPVISLAPIISLAPTDMIFDLPLPENPYPSSGSGGGAEEVEEEGTVPATTIDEEQTAVVVDPTFPESNITDGIETTPLNETVDAVVLDEEQISEESDQIQEEEAPSSTTQSEVSPTQPSYENTTTTETISDVKEEEEDSATTGTIELKSTVLVLLSNLDTQMNNDATVLFESVCANFLDENLMLATPPVYNTTCDVIGQSVVEGRRRLDRYLKKDDAIGIHHHHYASRLLRTITENKDTRKRKLEGSLTVEVEVTGLVDESSSVQEPADVPFDDLLVGTFNVQGQFFSDSLQEESLSDTSTYETSEYFSRVNGVRGMSTHDGSGAQEDTTDDGTQQQQSSDGIFSKGVIAAIAVGGVIVLLLMALLIVKGKRRHEHKSATASADSTSKKNVRRGKKKASTRAKTPTLSSPSGGVTAASSASPKSYIETSPSYASGEVEICLDSLPSPTSPLPAPPPPSPIKSSRVRRDVMCPSGKLGIMGEYPELSLFFLHHLYVHKLTLIASLTVSNTRGYGPAIHTIRPGSPMHGKLFVNDIIAAVNDVDTREYTAEMITQVMKDTVNEERKITVLSTHS